MSWYYFRFRPTWIEVSWRNTDAKDDKGKCRGQLHASEPHDDDIFCALSDTVHNHRTGIPPIGIRIDAAR